jgi:hypothetical protein
MLSIKQKLIYILIIFVVAVSLFPSGVEAEESGSKLIISEIQTGGFGSDLVTEDPQIEYIELYNSSLDTIELNGWELQYLKVDHDGVSPPTRFIATFNQNHKVLAQSTFVVGSEFISQQIDYKYDKYSSTGQLPKTGGTVRLVSADKTVISIIGYGTAKQFLAEPAVAPGVGNSIQVCLKNGIPLLSGNNKNDYLVYDTATMGSSVACVQTEPDPIPEPDPTDPPPTDPPSDNQGDQTVISTPNISCEGVVLSEIMPNPAGSDAGKEFIELHNPTNDFIDLSGCYITVIGNTKKYTLPNIEISPDEYITISDLQSGIILNNSSGGTVLLVDLNNNEIYQVTYPAGLEDDVSWALSNNNWQQTYINTPGLANVILSLKPCPAGQERNPDTGRCINIVSESTLVLLAPCPAGQERNPATNRCRLIGASSSALEPCKPGQIRNPETNRCKSVVETISKLTPCKPGQERNPETNRCRNIVVAASLKPCPAGQERNPDTGRCRKVAVINNGDVLETLGVSDVPTIPGSHNGLIIGGVVMVLTLAYGLWGWRQDIISNLGKLRFRR